MKIGKYIIEIVPSNSYNHSLNLPYHNQILYSIKAYNAYNEIYYLRLSHIHFKECKHIKPNTGIRYSILGKYWIFLVIKQLN